MTIKLFLIVLLCYFGGRYLTSAQEFFDEGDSADLEDHSFNTGSEFQELEYAAVEMDADRPYNDRVSARPNYSFDFGIDADEDKEGRSRSRQEVTGTDGRKVQGQYRVLQPDGTVKVVEYKSDPKTGNIKATVEYGRV